jgi:hypothetical protein
MAWLRHLIAAITLDTDRLLSIEEIAEYEGRLYDLTEPEMEQLIRSIRHHVGPRDRALDLAGESL